MGCLNIWLGLRSSSGPASLVIIHSFNLAFIANYVRSKKAPFTASFCSFARILSTYYYRPLNCNCVIPRFYFWSIISISVTNLTPIIFMERKTQEQLLAELKAYIRSAGDGEKTTAADIRQFITVLIEELYIRTDGQAINFIEQDLTSNSSTSAPSVQAVNLAFDASAADYLANTALAVSASSLGNRNRANHTGTQTAATISDFTSAVGDLLSAYDTQLKDGVPVAADTLKKLHNLILGQFSEVTVATISARDSYEVSKLPTNVFVINDGDDRWALYRATSTGTNAAYVKLSDPDLLGAVMSAAQIKSAYESNSDTNAFTNVLLNKLVSLDNYTDIQAINAAISSPQIVKTNDVRLVALTVEQNLSSNSTVAVPSVKAVALETESFRNFKTAKVTITRVNGDREFYNLFTDVQDSLQPGDLLNLNYPIDNILPPNRGSVLVLRRGASANLNGLSIARSAVSGKQSILLVGLSGYMNGNGANVYTGGVGSYGLRMGYTPDAYTLDYVLNNLNFIINDQALGFFCIYTSKLQHTGNLKVTNAATGLLMVDSSSYTGIGVADFYDTCTAFDLRGNSILTYSGRINLYASSRIYMIDSATLNLESVVVVGNTNRTNVTQALIQAADGNTVILLDATVLSTVGNPAIQAGTVILRGNSVVVGDIIATTIVDERPVNNLLLRTNTIHSSYVLSITDGGKIVPVDSTVDVSITIPIEGTYDIFPKGFITEISQENIGQVIITPETSGVILQYFGGLKTAGRYASVQLLKIEKNIWRITNGTV